MTKDLTKGSTDKVLLTFSLPMFISVVFQQLYSMADSIIAGKFAGKNALAAVGASYPVTMIFIAVALGCSVGVSVIVSQLFGKEDYKNMKTAVYTSLITIGILSVILTVFGQIFSSDMIRLLNTQSDIFDDSDLYLRIYIWGIVFLFMYNACTGIFNALGDSKTPLFLLIGSSIGNIVLDMLFVIVFHWDVAGVAWATFIAQGAASVVAFIVLIRRIMYLNVPSGKCPLFSFKLLGKISYIAVPSILQQSFVSVGNLFIQGLINGYGTDVVAGYSAAVKLNTFAITSFNTFSNALSNFTAQNYGAEEYGRIKNGFKSGLKIVAFFVVPFTLLYFVFAKQCIGLFLEATEVKAIEVGVEFLQIVSPFYIFVSLKLICDGILRGSAKIGFFMATTFSDLILRVALSFVLTIPFAYTGIWYSWPIGWVIATIIAVILYIVTVKKDFNKKIGVLNGVKKT